MKSAAVIIGCWAEHQPRHQQLISNIIDFVSTDDFDTILVSAEHNKLDNNTQGPNNWIDTEKRIFYTEQGVDWIRQQYHSAVEKRNRLAFSTASRSILDHDWQGKNCVAVSEQWQLEYMMNHNLAHVKQVWYFGIGWNLGVKQSGIGWGQLCDLISHDHIRPQIDILTNRTCILENLEPYSGKHFTQCQFDYPVLTSTEWKETQPNIDIKTNWQWSPGGPVIQHLL